MIQTPDTKTADQKFEINGWKITGVKAGVNYYKNFDKLGTSRKTFVRVSEFSEVSWNIRRRNIIPAVRSLVPLSVLIFLSWYCSFLPIESASTTIALNTTVFLAGVALYFSADRPSGFSLTLIDKYFVGFYLAHGTILLSELTIFIGKQTYDLTHILWQILIPIIFILSIIIFAYKAKNNPSNI